MPFKKEEREREGEISDGYESRNCRSSRVSKGPDPSRVESVTRLRNKKMKLVFKTLCANKIRTKTTKKAFKIHLSNFVKKLKKVSKKEKKLLYFNIK